MRARVCPDTTSSTFSWGRTRSRRSAHILPTLILQWRPLGIHNKAREWIPSQVWHMAAVFNPFKVTDNIVLYTAGHALSHLRTAKTTHRHTAAPWITVSRWGIAQTVTLYVR